MLAKLAANGPSEETLNGVDTAPSFRPLALKHESGIFNGLFASPGQALEEVLAKAGKALVQTDSADSLAGPDQVGRYASCCVPARAVSTFTLG
jgi:hypothetical protein